MNAEALLSNEEVFYPVAAKPTAPSTATSATHTPAPTLVGGEVKPESDEVAAAAQSPEIPSSTYDPHIADAFETLEYQARYDGRAADVTALAEGRKGLAETFSAFAVAEPAARELVSLVTQYRDAEPDPERMAATEAATMQTLHGQYGERTDAMIAGAQRVVREAALRIPWLVDELAKGGGNDPRVIDYFVKIANARGYV